MPLSSRNFNAPPTGSRNARSSIRASGSRITASRSDSRKCKIMSEHTNVSSAGPALVSPLSASLGFAQIIDDIDVTAAGARPTKVLSRLEWDASRDVYVGSGDKVYATGNLYNDAFIGLAVESRAGRTVQYVLDRGEGVS